MQSTEKENPKLTRALLDGKAPLEYLVWSVLEGEARVLKGGADKYGVRNWLKDRIKTSTYEGAMLRHLKAWAEGEDIDSESGHPHLQHLRACCAIVLDAEVHDTLIDDRDRCTSIDIKLAGKFDHCPDSTTFGQSAGLLKRSAPKYVVQFTYETPDFLSGTTFEGPFPTFEEARAHAEKNPNNIAGIRSVHTINKP